MTSCPAPAIAQIEVGAREQRDHGVPGQPPALERRGLADEQHHLRGRRVRVRHQRSQRGEQDDERESPSMKNSPTIATIASGTNFNTVVTTWICPLWRAPPGLLDRGLGLEADEAPNARCA